MRPVVEYQRGAKLTRHNYLLAVLLFLVGGCAGATFAGGSFVIHPRPELPKALVEPGKTFQKCGDDFYCLTSEDLEGLRKWVVRIQGVVEKYENAQNIINDSGP